MNNIIKISTPKDPESQISIIWLACFEDEITFAYLDTNNSEELLAVISKYIKSDIMGWKSNNYVQYIECLNSLTEAIRNNDHALLDRSMNTFPIKHPKDPVKMYKIILNHAFPKEDLQKYAPDLIEE